MDIASVSIFTILRVSAVLKIKKDNVTGTTVDDVIWAEMELVVGVITACLPLLQPPVSCAFGKDSAIRSLLRSHTSSNYERKSSWNSSGRHEYGGSNESHTRITAPSVKDYNADQLRRFDEESLELGPAEGMH